MHRIQGLTVSVADKSQAVGATTGWDAWATNETEEFVLRIQLMSAFHSRAVLPRDIGAR